jgi:hypothetical protein
MSRGSFAGLFLPNTGFHVEKKFPCNFKLILPVQSSPKKFFSSRFTQITSTSAAIPCSSRGAFRDRHGRWVRDAVDADGASDESA